MTQNKENNDGWIYITTKNKSKHKAKIKTNGPKQIDYAKCKKCEITTILPLNNSDELFKCVSNKDDNIILKCILDKLDSYYHNGDKFMIMPELGKYEIEVCEIHKKYVLLKQSHLHTDLTLAKSFRNHAFRFVRITW
jgi:hypothetical protein